MRVFIGDQSPENIELFNILAEVRSVDHEFF
jgi:hypothetical protein